MKSHYVFAVALAGVLVEWRSPGATQPLWHPLRDVREALHDESLARLAHRLPPKHAPLRVPGLSPLVDSTLKDPGGTGYGYYFFNTALLWTKSTTIDYFIITPSQLGGSSTDWLYLTTTCRAQLGTEALVGYYQQDEASFMVFDWARPDGQRWQIEIDLPTSHPEYLTIRPDEFGNLRQMCHARNTTRLLNSSAQARLWENQVLLFNFEQHAWDLIYSYSYQTASATDNFFQPGGNGYWGPIVETFGTYDRISTIGFDLVRFFQDDSGQFAWLSSANSYVVTAPPFHASTVAPNRSFAVYVGSKSLDLFPFQITEIGRDILGHTVALQVASLPARDFQTQAGVFLGDQLVWLPVGPPVPGTGGPLKLQFVEPLPTALYRVGSQYNSGSLCVVANQPEAGFTISPGLGLISADWLEQPHSNRWDKTVVGLRPGIYHVSFDTLPGMLSPPAQDFTISSNAMTTVEAIYTTNQGRAGLLDIRAARAEHR